MGVAIVAILACVVLAATGRGGEMARFPGDYAPPDFGAMAAVDVALLRPPTALWGYHMQVTDEALSQIATAISARDVRIATLEQQVADLRSRNVREQDAAAGAPGAREGASPGPGTWPDALTQPQPRVGGSRGWPQPPRPPQSPDRSQAGYQAQAGQQPRSEQQPEGDRPPESDHGSQSERLSRVEGQAQSAPSSRTKIQSLAKRPPAKEAPAGGQPDQAATASQPDEEESW
jgi:hypothetical protein